MKAKHLLVAAAAMILVMSACTPGANTPAVLTATPSLTPTATVERLDYFPEGDAGPFRFQLFSATEEVNCGFGSPCTLTATFREQAPHSGYPEGTAFVFETSGTGDPLSLVIPASHAERLHLSPGTRYQIVAQSVMNWPSTFGLIINQVEPPDQAAEAPAGRIGPSEGGDDGLVFQGIADWRLDASIFVGCLSPVRVEQVRVLAQRFREGGECLGSFTNTELRFSVGEEATTLHQGESATLGDYEINLDLARLLDRAYCPDAGAINASYTISKVRPGEPPPPAGTAEGAAPDPATAQPISVPDANLEAYLRRLMNKDTGPLLVSDLERLRCFVRLYPAGWSWEDSPNEGRITSLDGLEHATNLEAVYLSGAGISDLSPLGNLSRLTRLHADHNELGSLSPLEGLTSLTQLNMSNNNVSNLAPLASLTSLTLLDLGANSISDLSPLSSLTQLSDLSLYANQVADISPLASLVGLTRLRLDLNQVQDLAPISGLTSLVKLAINENGVEDVTPLSPLVHLAELSLVRNRITDISALSPLSGLVVLYLGDNQIRDAGALEALTNLRVLDLQGNGISDVSPLLRNLGLGEGDWVDVRANPLDADSVNRVLPELESRGVNLSW